MFIKKDHYNNKFFVALMWGVSIFITCVVIPYITAKIIVVIVLTLLSCIMYNKMKKLGIYADEKNIIIKNMCNQKKVSIENVVAVAIVKSIYKGKYKCSDLKDANGNQLYTFFLLSDYKLQMYNYKHGDFTFMTEFKEDVLGECVFNEMFFNWLLKEKTNIKIIDNRS